MLVNGIYQVYQTEPGLRFFNKHLRMKKVKLVSLRKLHLSGSLSDRQATKQYNLEDS